MVGSGAPFDDRALLVVSESENFSLYTLTCLLPRPVRYLLQIEQLDEVVHVFSSDFPASRTLEGTEQVL